MVEQAEFTYSPLRKALEKQAKLKKSLKRQIKTIDDGAEKKPLPKYRSKIKINLRFALKTFLTAEARVNYTKLKRQRG